MNCSKLVLCLFLMLALCPRMGAAQTPGQYFDPAHSGHGLDLQRAGGQWVLILYTYDHNGQPEWFLAVTDSQADGRIEGELERFAYQSDRFPPQRAVETVGGFALDFSAACAGSADTATFTWTIDGESDQWCVQSLLAPGGPNGADLTGQWYAGSADQGWGVSVDFSGSDRAESETLILYYYDTNGDPRWAFGVADQAGADSHTAMYNYAGYCRRCPPQPLEGTLAGTVSHRIEVVRGRAQGRIEVDLIYAFAPGGQWLRDDSPMLLLSDPAPGLVPIPEQLDHDTAIVIENVSVVPLTEEGLVLMHHSVLIEQGVIAAIAPLGTLPLPEGVWHVDGSGKFLGPGLADMHTHLTTSGQPAMNQSGLLLIANGVTTALNMGDGGTLNLPGLGQRFANGSLIGPTLYAGRDAYGPSDGQNPARTVSSRSGATSFAQGARDQGYDFLKLYNGLSPDVVDQFRIESERLGLPLIGHIPKSLSMNQALDAGMRMVAHTSEVYFTFLGNQPNSDRLPAAANQLISRNVFLTDTLTASESFSDMYGGNTANFNAYLQREGVQYVPQAMINGWAAFFNSAGLQPPGSRPGQLDARLAFFKQMNREFSDLGVKLILGTDSPSAHTGLVAGFAVHEDLRLLREIGLSAEQSYRIAARHPGEFIDATLAPAAGFGTVVVGKRADLLLLDDNPLESSLHLKRPAAVIARGRLWSRGYLQSRLDLLEAQLRQSHSESDQGLSVINLLGDSALHDHGH